MSFLLFVSLATLIGAGTWWLTQKFSERKHAGRIQDLESKVVSVRGEAAHLQGQVSALKGEVVALQKILCEERVSKQDALVALSQSFHKGLVGVSMMVLILGGGFAGGLSWVAATWRAETQFVHRNTEERIQFEITRLKLELFEKQFETSEKERLRIHSQWQEEKALRIASETRLEILTGRFGTSRDHDGFPLEDKALLEQTTDENIQKPMPGEPLSFLKETVFRR